MQQRIEHRYPVSPETYWSTYLDPAFCEALYLEGLDCHRVDITAWEVDDDGNAHRRLIAEPRVQAPPMIQRVIGKRVQFEEEGRFDAGSRVWRFTVKPAALSGRLEIEGDRTVIEESDGCRSVCHLRCRARVLGVGGAIERFISQQFAGNIEREATFMRSWLETRDAP
jgi:hypothetical protein